MPRITIDIDVSLADYKRVVRNESGFWAAFLAGFPVIKHLIQRKVDSELSTELFKQMAPVLKKEITEGLHERGIDATVRVSQRQ